MLHSDYGGPQVLNERERSVNRTVIVGCIGQRVQRWTAKEVLANCTQESMPLYLSFKIARVKATSVNSIKKNGHCPGVARCGGAAARDIRALSFAKYPVVDNAAANHNSQPAAEMPGEPKRKVCQQKLTLENCFLRRITELAQDDGELVARDVMPSIASPLQLVAVDDLGDYLLQAEHFGVVGEFILGQRLLSRPRSENDE
ncbi:hypothetical protein HG530_011825 [Fusarium avenaceum]|nr:hypothetical protein HG530_011825 [Fusarium avenaceum]